MGEKNWMIITHEERCSGCMICQLRCSYLQEKEFNPTRAFIKLELNKTIPTIIFLDDCTKCGQCAKYCLYDALELKEEAT